MVGTAVLILRAKETDLNSQPILSAARASLVSLVYILSVLTCTAKAERNKLKPPGFEPLTELPWKKEGATMESVLDAIFRETNPGIRCTVLAEYLRTIPVEKLGEAFETCVDLEGDETPDSLVAFFLEIWAKRDPNRCLARTKKLFGVLGMEDGWLAFDRWEQPRLVVQDLDAIRASRFRLRSSALVTFPLGVNDSNLPEKERDRILKEFTDLWSKASESDPRYRQPGYRPDNGYFEGSRQIIAAFDEPSERLPEWLFDKDRDDVAFEVGLRRWIKAKPGAAEAIIAKCQRERPSLQKPDEWGFRSAGVSIELLIIWSKLDLPSATRWVESLDIHKHGDSLWTRGFLMSRVNEATRERWLEEAKDANPENDDNLDGLVQYWAQWDPKSAIEKAISSGRAQAIYWAADGAASGEFGNTNHSGFEVIKNLDFSNLPEKTRRELYEGGWETNMEYWGKIDIGEAARYGYDFLRRYEFVPRENLIKLFSGDDQFSSDWDMLDRTFCALRVWAAVRPVEMKKWIASIDDEDMRKALTWLLNNPWGTGSAE